MDPLPGWLKLVTEVGSFALVASVVWYVFWRMLPSIQTSFQQQLESMRLTFQQTVDKNNTVYSDTIKSINAAYSDQMEKMWKRIDDRDVRFYDLIKSIRESNEKRKDNG